jgi:NAD dependent epimerase/dehydratase family enzyme
MPWIHIDDQVALIDYLLNESCSGPYNACSPEVVRNTDFTQILAQELGKPAIFHIPAWALRLHWGRCPFCCWEANAWFRSAHRKQGFLGDT